MSGTAMPRALVSGKCDITYTRSLTVVQPMWLGVGRWASGFPGFSEVVPRRYPHSLPVNEWGDRGPYLSRALL